MSFSISFGSMFNPKNLYRRHIDGKLYNPECNIERLNAHQKGSASIDKGDSAIKGLVKDTEAYKSYLLTPNELLGKVQVKTNELNLSEEDSELLNSLSYQKYGFFGNNGDFWLHEREKKEDNTYGFAMADGRLKEGTTKQEFIKELVQDNIKAFNVAGLDEDGKMVNKTFIYDEDTNQLRIYSKGDVMIEDNGFDNFKSEIDATIEDLNMICGATIWE